MTRRTLKLNDSFEFDVTFYDKQSAQALHAGGSGVLGTNSGVRFVGRL